MTQQGAALQTYNNELVKSLEELKARRAALQQQIEAESLEKRKLESEKARWGWRCLDHSLQVHSWCRLEERLDLVNGSLEEKMLTGREYDRVIQEAEQVSILAIIFALLYILLLTGVHQDLWVFASVVERGADEVSRP